MLGVRIGPVDQDIQKAFKLPSMDGAFVESVDAGKPADRAGVKPGDTIVQVDDTARPGAAGPHQLRLLAAARSGGSPDRRARRPRQTLTATLAPFEVAAEASRSGSAGADRRGRGERLGISVANLTPEIRQELDVRGNVPGSSWPTSATTPPPATRAWRRAT